MSNRPLNVLNEKALLLWALAIIYSYALSPMGNKA